MVSLVRTSPAVAFHASNEPTLRTEPFVQRMGGRGGGWLRGGSGWEEMLLLLSYICAACLRWRIVRRGSREREAAVGSLCVEGGEVHILGS